MNISIICPTVMGSSALKKLLALLSIGVAAIAAVAILILLTNLRRLLGDDDITNDFSVMKSNVIILSEP